MCSNIYVYFFFNDTATTEIYTLSLHDALPISARAPLRPRPRRSSTPGRSWLAHQGEHGVLRSVRRRWSAVAVRGDRKSTRLNSSHANISYAVFCLKKKKQKTIYDSYAIWPSYL